MRNFTIWYVTYRMDPTARACQTQMAGYSKDAAFRCYQCAVDFEQERSLLHHLKSKRHRELEDICNKVEELRQESDTSVEVPLLPETISPEANSENLSINGEITTKELDIDMDVSGSEQQGEVEVAQSELSAEEEESFDMEHGSLLMSEG